MMTFFKIKKHEPRKFNYKPRYYNAEKESMQNKLKLAEGDRGEAAKARIRESLERSRTVTRRQFKTNWGGGSIKLILIIAVILYVAYMVLHSWLPGLLNIWFPT